jgi:hypothetical protein
MTTEGCFESWQLLAGEDLSGAGALHKCVSADGKIAADITRYLGVLKSKGASGESVRVAIDGVVKVFAGAAISTPGNPVTVTTSGYVAPGTSTLPFIGRYVGNAACVSGDLIPVSLV